MLLYSLPAEAGFFHATSKAVARRILKEGFSIRKMNPKARFGSGVYGSKSMATAIKEKSKAESVVSLSNSKMLQKVKIDSRRLSNSQLKRMTGDRDLRGNIHKGVIGPDLGKKLGRYASRKGKVIEYRSVRDRNTNIFIPKKVYQEHPSIVNNHKGSVINR